MLQNGPRVVKNCHGVPSVHPLIQTKQKNPNPLQAPQNVSCQEGKAVYKRFKQVDSQRVCKRTLTHSPGHSPRQGTPVCSKILWEIMTCCATVQTRRRRFALFPTRFTNRQCFCQGLWRFCPTYFANALQGPKHASRRLGSGIVVKLCKQVCGKLEHITLYSREYCITLHQVSTDKS